jgi:DNA mismatch endonuclease (patch repair protein)
MSRIRGRNTRPELALRRALFVAGARGYRVHANLPGRPDVVFTRVRLAVFVDGCFWHGCKKCGIPTPRTNRSYWGPKLERNRARDRRTNRKLRVSGWSVLRFWEHQVAADPEACAARVMRRLQGRRLEVI